VHFLRPLKGTFFFVINELKIKTFDLFYRIIYTFGMLKECSRDTR